ncbi:MAG: phosphate/phosphite/phosphonate ABC transporter substrate-binding protein [Acidimicrobiales bacterium]
MGVQPFVTATKIIPAYNDLAKAISANLGCRVTVTITSDYAAETEAIRAGKLEFAEFPPFGFVLAQKQADLVPLVTAGTASGKIAYAVGGLAVLSSSPYHNLSQLRGQSVAFSAPTATSGHLLPAYGLYLAGVNPNTGIKAVYLGTHTATYEALLTGRVAAAELNSVEIALAAAAGKYDPSKIRMLYTSAPSPADPIVVRGDLPKSFQRRLKKALLAVDFAKLAPATQKFFTKTLHQTSYVPVTNTTYDGVRKIAAALHVTAANAG